LKIKGAKKLKVKTVDVFVGGDEEGQDVFIKLKGLPFDIVENLLGEIPDPTPPKGEVMRDGRGQTVMDSRGIPKQVEKIDDPGYLAEVSRANTARSIGMLMECLVPGQLEFESKREDFPNATDYYFAIKAEMGRDGIGLGAFTNLILAVEKVCEVTQGEIKAAKHLLDNCVKPKKEKEFPGHPSTGGSESNKSSRKAGKASTGASKPY